MLPDLEPERDPTHEWRAELLARFGWVLWLAGMPLVAYFVTVSGPRPILIGALAVALAAAALAALARRLDFRVRGLVLVLALVFLGAVLSRYSGPTPGTILCLVVAAVLASVMLGTTAGLVSLMVGATCFLILGSAGRLETTAERLRELPRLDTWVRMSITYSVLAGLLVMLVSRAVRQMERSLSATRTSLANAVHERAARAQAETALRENEERLRLALEAARLGTWDWNIETGDIARDGQSKMLLGSSPDGFGGTYQSTLELIHPDDRPVVEQAIAEALAVPNREYRVEYRLRGEPVRWIEGRGRVYRDERGRPLRMRGTAADITERKRWEDALRRSEAELRALFASMEDVILVLDSQGGYVSIAPTNPALLYRPPAELLGRKLHDVFPADEADAFLSQIRRCLATRQTLHFEYALSIGGERVWFAATVSPMLEDQVVWVARDVTRRQRAEEALRESEERWRRISEATSEGIAFSAEGVMIDVNAQLAQMLGYPSGELLGRPVLDCVVPEDRARVAEAIQSGHPGAYEHRALRQDGSTFPVEIRARALTVQGRPIRVTAVRDLSERTHLEAELRRRETLAAMGSLVAGVAHEVRTPLFSISATLDALEAGGGTPAQQQELKDLLRGQVRRLSSLMQDLLDYGRPPKLKLVRAGVREPLERAVRSCQPGLPAPVRIEVDVPDGLPEVQLDPARLEQVFENLVSNAVQHSPRGSRVRLAVRPVDSPRPGLACAVEDEGPGLNAGDLVHVFEPFFSRRPGGTGMGLAVAQRFVEAHGGTLTAANRPSGGSVFTVYLPVANEAGRGGAVA